MEGLAVKFHFLALWPSCVRFQLRARLLVKLLPVAPVGQPRCPSAGGAPQACCPKHVSRGVDGWGSGGPQPWPASPSALEAGTSLLCTCRLLLNYGLSGRQAAGCRDPRRATFQARWDSAAPSRVMGLPVWCLWLVGCFRRAYLDRRPFDKSRVTGLAPSKPVAWALPPG